KRFRVQEAKTVFRQAACARRRAVTGRGSSALLVKTNVPPPGSSPGASASDIGGEADLTIAKERAVRTAHPPPDVNLRRGATGVRHDPSRKYGQFPRNPARLGRLS
ncbi:MAG: hypothetical protein MJ240_10405, partial [Kiritimatiellae bacterium]|nr:hypothetical protein [Kiritimatiellia bacterium]